MYQHHNTDQIAFIIQDRRREAAARQLAAPRPDDAGAGGRIRPALQRLVALSRFGHLRARPARG